MTHTLLRRGQQNEWWGQQIKILKTTFDCTRLSLYFQEVRSAWNPRTLSTGIQTIRTQQRQRKRIFLIFWQIGDFSSNRISFPRDRRPSFDSSTSFLLLRIQILAKNALCTRPTEQWLTAGLWANSSQVSPSKCMVMRRIFCVISNFCAINRGCVFFCWRNLYPFK